MKDTNAVSSVVGVMLMLVVTLIVAASVSAFASGIFELSDKTPGASISAEAIIIDNEDSDINETQFEHLGGDAFSINSIYVVFQNEDSKTTLSKTSEGDECLLFELVGDDGDLVKAGSRFKIVGEEYGTMDGLEYGSFVLEKDSIVSWKVYDKTTDKLIATGNMVI